MIFPSSDVGKLCRLTAAKIGMKVPVLSLLRISVMISSKFFTFLLLLLSDEVFEIDLKKRLFSSEIVFSS